MYGPPPDPRQVAAPVALVQAPGAYAACAAVGLGLSLLALWRRPPVAARAAALILGQVVALTAPLAAFLDRYVYGSFPTIDKEGSLLFYLDGVHLRALLHPLASLHDPAVALIGVHTGHLWVTAFFDLFLSPVGAMNAQALLYPALAWWAAWLLLRDLCGDARVAFVISFAWGMGLRVFADLNWATIEKAAIFWLALHAWALHRAWRDGGRWPLASGLILGLATWMNLYLGLVGGAVLAAAALAAGWEALRRRGLGTGGRRLLAAAAWGALAVAPLAAWQALLLRSGPALASPDDFLWKRAALDSFTLWPPRWDRLEVHRALNLVVIGLGLLGLARRRADPRVRFLALATALLFALSLGPRLWPTAAENPVYMLARAVVPGFWRVAKPEVFFHGAWLGLCAVAAVELKAAAPRRGGLGALYAIFVLAWLLMVRTHPAYPGMSVYQPTRLAPDWAERVFERAAPATEP